jgi:hypothetical protein
MEIVRPLVLEILPYRLAVCRLAHDVPPPDWAQSSRFSSVTRTGDELSIVCEESTVPDSVRAERGWRSLKVQGPLDFSLTGILASIAAPLAEAGISVFAVATFDTDYVLVRDSSLAAAVSALRGAGHQIAVGG